MPAALKTPGPPLLLILLIALLAAPSPAPAVAAVIVSPAQTVSPAELEGDAGFRAAATRATVLSAHERAAFRATEGSEAGTGRNTLMPLPFGVGQTWDWGGGPHGWSASPGEPRSSVDLSGGDERVLADGTWVANAFLWTGATPG